MMMPDPLMEAERDGGDPENPDGAGRYSRTIVCPDGGAIFKLTVNLPGK